MPCPFFVIDGYNLLHAAGLAWKGYGPGGLERARLRLLHQLLVLLTPEEVERTTVVFDARPQSLWQPEQQRVDLHGLTVLFVPDADSEIEQLIRKHSAPKQLRVVSGDHRLHRAARRRRAQPIDSEVFLQWLHRRAARPTHTADRPDDSAHPKYTGQVSPKETAEWLATFGDIPEARQLARDLKSWSESELEFWQRRVADLRDLQDE